MAVSLNGFLVSFPSKTFTIYEQDLPDPKELKPLREKMAHEWFLHWRAGKVYGIPRIDQPQVVLNRKVTLPVNDHNSLHILTDRLNDLLPTIFPMYSVFRSRPFAFLAQKDELVEKITSGWSDLPSLVSNFKIRPKFELEPKIIEVTDGEVAVALFMVIHTRWEILAPLDELIAAGLDLNGLHVIRRDPAPGERRLVGKIASVAGSFVRLSESFDNIDSVPVDQVWLEGRRDSFQRCLGSLLGGRFKDFENRRVIEEASFLSGPDVDRLLAKMEGFLKKGSPLKLTEDLECTVTGRVQINNKSGHQSLVAFRPVEYCFDTAKAKRHAHPWTGLERYGPYSRDSFSKKTPRILVVCPDTQVGRVQQSVKLFRDGITALAKSAYPNGFSRTLHLVNPDFRTLQVPMLSKNGHRPSDAYRRTLEDHLARDTAYDAAIVVTPEGRNRFLPADDPYLHAKALLLLNGIPVQEAVTATLAKSEFDLQYIFRNIAVSLYAKMGGVPWTVDHDLTVDDEIVIGLGTAELSESRFESRQRHIGITTVFRGDGNYLLSNLSRECSYDEYPEVLERSTLEVLEEIKNRNGWRPGDTIRVVFHAFKPFKNVEVSRIVARCLKQVGSSQEVKFAFLTVSFDHPFKVIDTASVGKAIKNQVKGRFAPERGLMVQLGSHTRLLCTKGPSLIKRPTTPLPSPLLIHLHRDSTYVDLAYLTEQVLKFTALSWRSIDPAERPVTIYYSELIADLLTRLKAVPGWSPAVLNSKLRTSKWFL